MRDVNEEFKCTWCQEVTAGGVCTRPHPDFDLLTARCRGDLEIPGLGRGRGYHGSTYRRDSNACMDCGAPCDRAAKRCWRCEPAHRRMVAAAREAAA